MLASGALDLSEDDAGRREGAIEDKREDGERGGDGGWARRRRGDQAAVRR
jgi:hypothetical protein